jgi:hypothetical protein
MVHYRCLSVCRSFNNFIYTKFFYAATMILIMTLGLIIYAGKTPAYAEGSNVVISAKVQPVREIVVNQQHRIIKIISNTSENIEPSIWLDSKGLHKQAITPYIADQYNGVFKSLPSKKDRGLIYSVSKLNHWQQVGILIIKKMPATDITTINLSSLF